MNRENMSAYLITLFALVVIVILFVRLFPDDGTDLEVILPAEAGSSAGLNDPSGWHDSDLRLELTPETVQAVIATLETVPSYSRILTFRTFWPGGEGLSTIEVKAKNDMLRISETIGVDRRNALILGEQLYIWYNYGKIFSGSAARDEADRLQRMVSVQYLLELPPASIQDASYTELDGVPCIYVEFLSGELGFSERAYVSVSTGLLMGADSYSGETLLTELRSGEPDVSTPDDVEFQIPR